ncbi:hypothetical protein [Fibrobacter sp. UWH4]|uniref:hypothetical protein n=1 Tax=Fibrobacter sp. UWH4 TaxID=1896210 RepID=UPI000911515F|nr:hypothetical protein [Fibrobacter sp. UWH4]SHL53153.1 hypothetical protein SAMN05720762_107113 [Fibrobacter sp. UWH4]
MNKNDNINERYEAYEKKLGSMKCALGNFNRITEQTYAVFRDVVNDHPIFTWHFCKLLFFFVNVFSSKWNAVLP